MTIPERYRTHVVAILAAIAAIIGLAIVDLSGDDEASPPTTVEPTSTSVETTTTVHQHPSTTVAPGDEFPDVPSAPGVVEAHLDRPGWGVGTGYPAFRMFCEVSHVAYVDPILAPGSDRFMHLHMFFGNTTVGPDSTWETLRTTGGTTCQGGPINRTAYWFPAVFDSAGRVVMPDSFELYYKAENIADPSQLQPYPNGLRMIGGNGYGGGAEMNTPARGGHLRLTVRFPYCWNGRDLWLPGGAHMAYGTNNTWGPCPETHPVHLPELTEFADFHNVHEDTRSWRLSSDIAMDRPRGSTLHADWFGAWDRDVMEWFTECLRRDVNASGGALCDLGGGTAQLDWPDEYRGPRLLDGWTAAPGS